jgi:hypothetical protein
MFGKVLLIRFPCLPRCCSQLVDRLLEVKEPGIAPSGQRSQFGRGFCQIGRPVAIPVEQELFLLALHNDGTRPGVPWLTPKPEPTSKSL